VCDVADAQTVESEEVQPVEGLLLHVGDEVADEGELLPARVERLAGDSTESGDGDGEVGGVADDSDFAPDGAAVPALRLALNEATAVTAVALVVVEHEGVRGVRQGAEAAEGECAHRSCFSISAHKGVVLEKATTDYSNI
jgi:hypothetical protein